MRHSELLKRNICHSFGAMHLNEIIKTYYVQLKSRISRQWFTQNVQKILKVGDSGHFSE